jgi:hypothetical protein
MSSSKTIKRTLTISKNKFNLEIYPAREGNYGTEGPYWEIFPHDYHAALYAFSNKDKLNKIIKNKYMNNGGENDGSNSVGNRPGSSKE